MTWLVPYVINGAAHSAALFRRQAQRPSNDQTGVARPADLKVMPLPSAGPGFRIAQGGLSIVSRFPGRDRESYGVENGDSVLTVDGVNGTGSAARRDAVVVEVIDPNYLTSEWTHDTAAPLNYMKVHVVEGVDVAAKDIDGLGATWRDRTAYVLAFINWPANQTSVQASYIEDARQLANPLRSEETFARPRIAADEVNNRQFLTVKESSGGEVFPGGPGSPNQFQIDVPIWATRMIVDPRWMTVLMKGNPWGYYWLEWGTEYRPNTWPNKQSYEFASQKFGFHAPNTADTKGTNLLLMEDVPVDEKLRGKRVTFAFKASRRDESQINSTHQVWMEADSGLGCRITFTQSARDVGVA